MAGTTPFPPPTPPPEEVDNPPPYKPKLGGHGVRPWHQTTEEEPESVDEWEPGFRALVHALDRTLDAEQWGLAFAQLRAAARRNLSFVRANEYNDFLDVLDDLSSGYAAGIRTKADHERLVDIFREMIATTDADHVRNVLDVTFRARAIAEKQKNRQDPVKYANDELADPPTRAETLAALRLLRGIWIWAPRSKNDAGEHGAVEALLRCLVDGVPDPDPGTTAGAIARELKRWNDTGGWAGNGGDGKKEEDDDDEEEEEADGDGDGEASEKTKKKKKKKKKKKREPPFMIRYPDGPPKDGETPKNMQVGWTCADPNAEFGQPSQEEIQCEALEALLALLADGETRQRDFVARGGLRVVAERLVPWLAVEGGEEEPTELVQRCIVFLGVLVQHVLPGRRSRKDGAPNDAGAALAREAVRTLERVIGVDAAEEILTAAEELSDDPYAADDTFERSDSDDGETGPGGSPRRSPARGRRRGERGERAPSWSSPFGAGSADFGEALFRDAGELLRATGVESSRVDGLVESMRARARAVEEEMGRSGSGEEDDAPPRADA